MSPDDKALEAIRLALEWDERRGYLMPYSVRDKLRLAYEHAKQKGEAEGWRDIESAPKDGTNILLAHARAVFDGYWDAYANGWVDDVTDLYEDKITYQATHWRPLPEPPMLSAGGEG